MSDEPDEEAGDLQMLVAMARLRVEKRSPPASPDKIFSPGTAVLAEANSSAVRSSPIKSNQRQLSTEILLRIIQCFMPRTGVCISNDPERDTDIKTVRALLKTNRWIREETLKHVFTNPLQLYIASGARCRCHLLAEIKDIFKTPWEKVFLLPLQRWQLMVVTFAPGLGRSTCAKERQYLKITPPRHTDLAEREFHTAVACVTRQSFCLGTILDYRQQHPTRSAKITNIRFAFDESVIESSETNREKPFWHLALIDAMLLPWRWTSRLFSTPEHAPRVQYPKRLAITFDLWSTFQEFELPDDDAALRDMVARRAQTEYSPCWMMKRRDFGNEEINPLDWSELMKYNLATWQDHEVLSSDLRPVSPDPYPGLSWSTLCDLWISIEKLRENGVQIHRWRGDRIAPFPY